LDQFCGAPTLIVLVATDGFFVDLEMIQKLLGLPGVFAGDAVYVTKNLEGAEGDVAEVADGGGDEVEAGGERGV
jgi:hypothetical protein